MTLTFGSPLLGFIFADSILLPLQSLTLPISLQFTWKLVIPSSALSPSFFPSIIKSWSMDADGTGKKLPNLVSDVEILPTNSRNTFLSPRRTRRAQRCSGNVAKIRCKFLVPATKKCQHDWHKTFPVERMRNCSSHVEA